MAEQELVEHTIRVMLPKGGVADSNGKMWVPTGEYRRVKEGEYWLGNEGDACFGFTIHGYPILRPAEPPETPMQEIVRLSEGMPLSRETPARIVERIASIARKHLAAEDHVGVEQKPDIPLAVATGKAVGHGSPADVVLEALLDTNPGYGTRREMLRLKRSVESCSEISEDLDDILEELVRLGVVYVRRNADVSEQDLFWPATWGNQHCADLPAAEPTPAETETAWKKVSRVATDIRTHTDTLLGEIADIAQQQLALEPHVARTMELVDAVCEAVEERDRLGGIQGGYQPYFNQGQAIIKLADILYRHFRGEEQPRETT